MYFDIRLMANSLGKNIENIADEVALELQMAVRDVAHSAHLSIITGMQARTTNPAKRAAYLGALHLTKIPDGYIIFLDNGWATKMEDGIDPYDMKEVLLRSGKVVGIGSRAGKPWVQIGKDGKKFAFVPFRKHPWGLDPGSTSGDLIKDIKKLTAINLQGRKQKLIKTFKTLEGTPVVGKAAVVKPFKGLDPYLANLTKYQSVGKKGNVMSAYIVFRTVSENSPPGKWMHPGADGYNLFKDAEQFVSEELENIIQLLL